MSSETAAAVAWMRDLSDAIDENEAGASTIDAGFQVGTPVCPAQRRADRSIPPGLSRDRYSFCLLRSCHDAMHLRIPRQMKRMIKHPGTLTTRPCCQATAVALHGLLWLSLPGARASVSDLQAAAASHADLTHQYTFDGAVDDAPLADKKGGADLQPSPFGSGWEGDIGFGQAGFDESSKAVSTARGPGADFAEGAGLIAPFVELGDALSFEVIFQPAQAEISGGNFNLGYILTTRAENERGYLLVQGDAPLPSTGQALTSTIGDGFNRDNQNRILEEVVPGHWYYAAGSYRVNEAEGTVTFTNYVADLTAGETEITQVGPFTNAGGSYPIGGAPLGIGGRWDAGESFPGLIDEVNLYGAELPRAQFQAHLDLLLAGGGAPFVITDFAHDAGGGSATVTWNSVAGAQYAIEASGHLSTWERLSSAVSGQDGATSFTEDGLQPGAKRFYRVLKLP